MSGIGKSKGKQKGDFDAKVKALEERFSSLREFLNEKVKELVTKHNALAQDIEAIKLEQQKIALAASTDVRNIATGYQAMRSSVIDSIETIDINIQGMGEVLRETFGQLEVLSTSLTKKDLLLDLENLSTEELATLRRDANDAYGESIARGLKKARADRQRELEEKAAAETPPEAPVMDEQAIEKELRDSEAPAVSAVSGGGGADIPEGADVFGG